jgi:phenylpropionate dioxygenase-like ring-hydroxylating dioxygenase large terminal subunit
MANPDYSVLTQVGAGTPMGKLIRRYWIPAAMSAEIPDERPVRLRLLGENLVAFRTAPDGVGIVGEFCPHRRASLLYARNEGSGLRCLYHGWRICPTGDIDDMPAEPPDTPLKAKVRAVAYPTFEAGGIVWAYMGPADKKPPFPHFPWLDLPPAHRLAAKMYQECNYLQGVEGDFDPAHPNFLHRDFDVGENESWQGTGWRTMQSLMIDAMPRIVCEPSPYGMRTAAIRKSSDPGRHFVRIYETVAPFYSFIPSGPHESQLFKAWHPIDDVSCFTFYIHFDPQRPLDRDAIWQNWGHRTEPPGYATRFNLANQHLQSAEAMKRNFSGIAGAAIQDLALQESMGPIVDRAQENLGTSDVAVVNFRRLLLRLIEDNEAGRPLPGQDPALDFDLRGTSIDIPIDRPWQEARRVQDAFERDNPVVAKA